MFKIVSKQKIAPKEFDIWVEAARIAKHAKAGQFVVLRVDDHGERIPLTIADYDKEKGLIRLIFQVVGKTTAAMSCLNVGDCIKDISGPLGTPSEVEKYGCRKLGIISMPYSCATPNTISMPPEKSAYCCSEYSKMASSAIEPASLGSLPSRMAAIVGAVRFAMA